MEDFSRVGVDRYRASHLISPSNTKVIFKTTYFALKALYHFLLALLAQLWINIKRTDRHTKLLANQIVLVTGGGNGFGRALCLELAYSEKCHVAVVDLDFEAAKITANVVKSMGQKAFAYKVSFKSAVSSFVLQLQVVLLFQADVSNYAQVEELYQSVKRDLGTVDVLVNNAGIVPLMSFQERSPEDVQRIMDVNVMSHFWVNPFHFRIIEIFPVPITLSYVDHKIIPK